MGHIKNILILSLILSVEFAQTPMIEVVETREPEDEFSIAAKYGISKELFVAILKVESNLDHKAINPATLDFGIGQINYKTAESYGFDVSRLTKDRTYSIKAAAIVLSDFQKNFKDREPDTWMCRFNVGTARPLPDRLKYKCEIYLRKIKVAMGDF